MRQLVLVLGDQLDRQSAAFDGFDAAHDAVWMSETPHEITHVRCHRRRVAVFLAAMRHFRDRLQSEGIEVRYAELAADPADDRGHTFGERLALEIARSRPERLVLVEPGDWRVERELAEAAARAGVPLEIRVDRSFLCSRAEFAAYDAAHPGQPMESFYRWMRRRLGILVDADGNPAGGRWNFDAENRHAFGRQGPGFVIGPVGFEPDATTRAVLALVATRCADHPGTLDGFDLPVTREHALALLDDFVAHRLADFGFHQDAMWTGENVLSHSRLSVALNLKLIRPREVIDAVLAAATADALPLNSVEGFVRQVLGWREYVHGIYWRHMPRYATLDALDAHAPLPAFYWTGETAMNCLSQCTRQLLGDAYSHHIQRLMVFGNYALLAGVDPLAFNDWHLAMFVDAVDWVSLPNTFGMSQHADGGIVGTKPYIASGRYIERMSDYCAGCRFDPGRAAGERACPFTTLYWDFLDRHRRRLADNPRMRHALDNAAARPAAELEAIRVQAEALRRNPP